MGAAFSVLFLLHHAKPVFAIETHNLFQHHGAIMLLIDTETGQIIRANQAAVDFYGYPLDALQGLLISQINALSSDQIRDEMAAAAAQNRNYFIFPHRLANGEMRTVEVYSWPIHDGDTTKLFSIIHDVSDKVAAEAQLLAQHAEVEALVVERTEWLVWVFGVAVLLQASIIILLFFAVRQRKQFLARLSASEKYNRALFADSRIAQVVINPISGQFRDCNEAAIAIYGFTSRKDVLGKTPLDVSAPIQADGTPSEIAAQAHIAHAKQHGSAVFEWRHRRPDGHVWDADTHLMLVEHQGEQLLLFSLIDITKRKQAEAALQETLATLQSQIDMAIQKTREQDNIIFEQNRHKSLTDLLVNLAHQWRQPLSAVALTLQEIDDEYQALIPAEQLEPFRATLDRGVGQIMSLSETLNYFTSLYESNETPTLVNIAEALKQGLTYFDIKYYYDGVLIVESSGLDASLELRARKSDMTEILIEVVQNACTAAHDQRLETLIITVRGSRLESGALYIEIEDNAGGIDQSILPVIFAPYATTAFKERNKGLGLYMLKRIVEERYHGTIQAGNTQEGARIAITLDNLSDANLTP
ncbi:PAS domain S-box protein [Chrysiogenes arsenatis]|uniref:PAS domain S-box protein n=1 Tax=Chrysiogenes arsenatis TaxID=309797 RepID=UPI0003FE8DFE|nr:PAS domain S-box protein [Chrysiogenes arsenatis]